MSADTTAWDFVSSGNLSNFFWSGPLPRAIVRNTRKDVSFEANAGDARTARWNRLRFCELPMDPLPSVRPFLPHEWRMYRDLRLRALEDSPDAFGMTLAEERDRSDAEWSTRLAAGGDPRWNLPVVAEVDGEPIGLAWGRIEPSTPELANLYQMWVDPKYRNLGAGRMLLEAVIDWARDANVRYLALGVTCGDSAAARLYARAGFQPVGEPEPLRPGSSLLMQPMRLELRSAGT